MDRSYPKVTVVTPSYNQGQFIEDTILSVLNQTYKNIEYIVVDGGSTDNTMEVVNKYRDRIDIVIHEKDKGQADAINKGFKLATGELVGWINSDDLLYSTCVEKIAELYSEKPNGSIYYNCNGRMIDGNGNTIRDYSKKIYHKKYLLNSDSSVLQQGSFYRSDLVKKVGYLNDHIHYCMDLDLWLRLLDEAPIYFSDYPPLGAFRIWGETKTFTGRQRFLKNIREVLVKHGAHKFSKPIVQTYWYTFKADLKDLLGVKHLAE